MTSTLSFTAGHDPRLLHPEWCDLDRHDYVGNLDQRHISAPQVMVLADDLPDDRATITVRVEQYAGRPGGAGVWELSAPEVLVEVNSGEKGSVALTPDEVRQLNAILDEHYARIASALD